MSRKESCWVLRNITFLVTNGPEDKFPLFDNYLVLVENQISDFQNVYSK